MAERELTFKTQVRAAKNGVAELCIAQPGVAMGIYFSEEVLAAAAPLFEGAATYVDHSFPYGARKVDDMTRWAGYMLPGTKYDPEGPAGSGLYGSATVFPHWQFLINSAVGTDAGMSFNVLTSVRENGPRTEAEAIIKVSSVDYVVHPALAGRVIALVASMQGDAAVTSKNNNPPTDTPPANVPQGGNPPPANVPQGGNPPPANVPQGGNPPPANVPQGGNPPPANVPQGGNPQGQAVSNEALLARLASLEAKEASRELEGSVKASILEALTAAMPSATEEDVTAIAAEVVGMATWASVDAAKAAATSYGKRLEEGLKAQAQNVMPTMMTFDQAVAAAGGGGANIPDQEKDGARKALASLFGVEESKVDL